MSADSLILDKRVVRVALWFRTPDFGIIRIYWKAGDPLPVLPEDGYLTGKTLFADGTGENIGGDGWLVFGMTPVGLLCQVTGGDKPDASRYPDCQFSRCQIAPSALLHVAFEEAAQWH